MTERKSRFITIDELQAQVDLETACRFYGVDPGPLEHVGKDIRTKCFLNCGKAEETSSRAIGPHSPAKRWPCHQYGCGEGGKLVTLCDFMKPATNFEGQKPKGERFIEIREDLRRLIEGNLDAEPVKAPSTAKQPLADHPYERACTDVNLDEKFVVHPDESMSKGTFVSNAGSLSATPLRPSVTSRKR